MPAKGTGPKAFRRKRYPIEQYDRVSTMLIAMVPYSMIEKQLCQEWKKPKKYVQDLIKTVHEDWADASALTQGTRRHQVRQAFETLYMKSTAAKDHNGAARILREIGLLDGVYQPTKVEVSGVTGTMNVGISLGALGFKSPEEVQARIDELRAKVASEGAGALAATQPTAAATALLTGQPVPTNATTQDGEETPDQSIIDVTHAEGEGTP